MAPAPRPEMSGADLRRGTGVAAHAEDGFVFAACLPEGPMYILDMVGAIIWEETLAGGREGLVARVADRTGGEPDAIRADVEAFVGELVRRGLLAEVS